MTVTTAKDRLHQLIDGLTEDEAKELELSIKLSMIPEDDEPLSDEEIEAIHESKDQVARGEVVSSDEAKRGLRA